MDAKTLWDTAIEHLEQATKCTSAVESDAYVNIGQLALAAAQFAVNNPAVILGVDMSEPPPLPPGAPPLPTWGRS